MKQLWNANGTEILVPDDRVDHLVDAGWRTEPPAPETKPTEPVEAPDAAEDEEDGNDARQ